MLTITTLGGLSISVDDQPIPRAVTAKALALLCYLAVTARPHTREALLALLWSEMDETEAQNNLRQALFQLKKYAEPYLLVTRTEVSFDRTQAHSLDVNELERLARRDDGRQTAGLGSRDDGRRTTDDEGRPSSVVRRPGDTSLLSGEFLQGFSVKNAPEFEEWVAGQRARFGETAAQVLLQRARLHAVAANMPAALDALNRLLARDPWREEAHRDKMLLLARDGQTSAALAQFATCTDSLRRELNIPPATETRHLAERIARAQQRPPPVLPSDAAAFVGRAAERAELTQRLAHGDARLVTVLGPGGMGKTRLVMEVLRDLRHAFLEGVTFVSLQAVNSENEVLPAVMTVLGLAATRNPLQSLSDFLREKEMLLVLDNFEPVLDAAPDLSKLLQAAPGLRLLITSRQRLSLRWEEVFELSGLSLARDRSAALITAQSAPIPDDASDAENLFIARARNLLRNFAPSTADTANIQQVCSLLEGVPLAIELASSMMHAMPVAGIAKNLEQDLGNLSSPMHDAPERQRSLRTVFNHSWAVLSDDERKTVQRLSIFRGGFSANAAAVIAHASPQLLAQLADKSFIHLQGTFDSVPRYAMHEVLRVFADETFTQSSEATALRNDHCDFFAEQMTAQFAAFSGPRQSVVSQALRRDDANLVLAWALATSSKNVRVLQRMLPALLRYANVISRTDFWLTHFLSALTTLADQPDALVLCAMLRTRVAACLNQNGDYDVARAMLVETLNEMRSVLSEDEVQFAELVLGNGYLAQGKLDEAQAIYGQLLEADEMQTAYAAQANLAIVETRLGQYERAAFHLQANRARAHTDQNVRDEAIATLNLATVFLWQRDLAQTERTLREAEGLFAQTDYEIGKARTQANLGELMLEMQRLTEADLYLQRALRMTRELGTRHLICSILGNLGKLALLRQHYAEASEYLDECLAMARAIGSDDHLGEHLQTAADLALAQGNLDVARETLHAALRAARAASVHRQKIKSLLRLARLDVSQNRTMQAQRTLASLTTEAKLPADLSVEIDILTQSLPASATPATSLDALLSELLGSL